ncbi:hypothetical protein BC827DRAFT_16386 [Russula dissimulans]|nr:hypothetical protein BC827DRAFT_16386 [Russula dissimulans]
MSTNPCNTISANADVLGKGVRVNFYFTMILLAAIPRAPDTLELLTALYAAANFSGLGLLLTAIIQTALNQLSIFEGLFVFHCLFFLGIGAAPSGKYLWSKRRIAMGFFIQFASVVAFIGWGMYFWIHVKDLGQRERRGVPNHCRPGLVVAQFVRPPVAVMCFDDGLPRPSLTADWTG